MRPISWRVILICMPSGWVMASGWIGATGALIHLQTATVTNRDAFSVLTWTALVIFIVVIGGVGSTIGPVIGVVIYWISFVIVDKIVDGEVALIFNTTEGWQSLKDSQSIRASALREKVPYFTTAAASWAATQAIAALRGSQLEVRSLQSYYS